MTDAEREEFLDSISFFWNKSTDNIGNSVWFWGEGKKWNVEER